MATDPEDNDHEEMEMSSSHQNIAVSDEEEEEIRVQWKKYIQKPQPFVRLVDQEEDAYQELCIVRIAVFVQEQGVPLECEFIEQEDSSSSHIGIFLPGTGCVGTCRLRPIEPYVKLERVAILKDYKGKGYGEMLVKFAIQEAYTSWPRFVLAAHAQTSSLELYRKLGAFVVGPRFMEEEIERRSITFQCYRGRNTEKEKWKKRELILTEDLQQFAKAHNGELFDTKVLQKVRMIAESIESARIVSPMNIIHEIDYNKSKFGLVYNTLRLLVSRAFAVDEDYFDEHEPSIRRAYEEVRKLADHKLNVGNYAEIDDHWRLLYAAADITGSVFFFPNNESRSKLSTENSYRELSLKALDSSVLKGKHIFTKKWLIDRVNVLKETLPPPPPFSHPYKESDPIPPPLPNSVPVDSIDFNDFDTEEEFTSFVYHNVLKGEKPVLLKNFFADNQTFEKWSHSHLNELLAYRSLPVEVGFKYTDDRWTQIICTGQEFFEMMSNPSKEGPAYMAQYGLQNSIPELADMIDTPEFVRIFAKRSAIEINLWIGPEGTVSPLHRDPKDNVFCQQVGTKFVRLISPEDEDELDYHTNKILKNTSSLDVENPDLNVHPDFSEVTCYDTLVHPGDGLFIPRQWYHHVRALSPSTSINYWLPILRSDGSVMDRTSTPVFGSDIDYWSLPKEEEEAMEDEEEAMENEEKPRDSEPEQVE